MAPLAVPCNKTKNDPMAKAKGRHIMNLRKRITLCPDAGVMPDNGCGCEAMPIGTLYVAHEMVIDV